MLTKRGNNVIFTPNDSYIMFNNVARGDIYKNNGNYFHKPYRRVPFHEAIENDGGYL